MLIKMEYQYRTNCPVDNWKSILFYFCSICSVIKNPKYTLGNRFFRGDKTNEGGAVFVLFF